MCSLIVCVDCDAAIVGLGKSVDSWFFFCLLNVLSACLSVSLLTVGWARLRFLLMQSFSCLMNSRK